ncbi:glycoprotein [Wuhan redfin culter dimarhabdovirus]|uniref:Glycoprotein n=1 Tax=Wuhan redfin culter dimarhabdovirus TaxID=3071315 RepID=A0AAD0MN29_9RHAB|nr:glycoprotein [Wuhan redfin culter dimarhabodovirus]AVM87288.1 glycoprotein [Wuhan redfin culter dimarhabodovirus]
MKKTNSYPPHTMHTITLILWGYLLKVGHSANLFLPFSEPAVWKRSSVKNMKCPTPLRYEANHPAQEEVTFYSFSSKYALHKQEGYLCHKTRWSVTCAESFFGVQTISERIDEMQVSLVECQEAVTQRHRGSDPHPVHPLPNCGWMKTNTEHLDYVLLTDHPVVVDHYTSWWIDEQFVGGRCSTSPCQTRVDSILWIANGGLKKIAPYCVSGTGFIEPIEWQALNGSSLWDWNHGSIFSSRGFVRTTFRNACWLVVCDRKGIRFASGEWASLDVKTDSLIKPVLHALPECPTGTKIVPHHISEPSAEDILIKLDRELLADCLMTLREAQERKKVDRLLLSYMFPDHSGRGLVYRMRNGTLESGVVNYIEVTLMDWETVGKPLGVYRDEVTGRIEDYHLTGWTKPGEDGIRHTYNGISANRTTRSIPVLALRYQVRDSDVNQYIDDIGLPHPALQVRYNQTELSTTILDQHSQGKELSTVVMSWFGSIWSQIGFGIVLLILVCVIILVLWKWKPRTCTCPPLMTPRDRVNDSWTHQL